MALVSFGGGGGLSDDDEDFWRRQQQQQQGQQQSPWAALAHLTQPSQESAVTANPWGLQGGVPGTGPGMPGSPLPTVPAPTQPTAPTPQPPQGHTPSLPPTQPWTPPGGRYTPTPAPTQPTGGTTAQPRNGQSFDDFVQNYWAPDRRNVLLNMLKADYWAPDRNAVIARYQNMPDAEMWPHGVPAGATGGGTTGGTTSGPRWDAAWFQQNIGTPNTMAELLALQDKIKAAGGKLNQNASGQWNGKITTPDGRIIDIMYAAGEGGKGFQWLEGGGGDNGNPAVGYGNSQSTELFLNELLSRLEQLRQPINDPYRPVYEQFAMDRINSLGGDPYTAGEDAALRAKYMNPLAQARDAEYEHNRENIGARGMLASSGLLGALDERTGQNYQGAVGAASNDLAVQAIDEKQRRQNQQLEILMNLLGEGRNVRAEDNARGVELLQTSALPMDLDERRLQMLLQASGEGGSSPASIMQSLMSLGNLGLTQQQLAQQNKSQSSYAWGQMLPYLLQALGLGGTK
jgi:hypothetical protein